MASGDVVYTVLNPTARRLAVAPMMAEIAAEIAATAAGLTPVGKGKTAGSLAGSYSTKPGRDPGTTLAVSSGVAHGKSVEYGTRKMAARAPMGRAFASAKGRYGG